MRFLSCQLSHSRSPLRTYSISIIHLVYGYRTSCRVATLGCREGLIQHRAPSRRYIASHRRQRADPAPPHPLLHRTGAERPTQTRL
jgi:hypothetical protein